MELPEIPPYFTFAIPFFFLLIGIELFVARKLKLDLYRFNDSISDLSAGIFSQVVGGFARLLFLGAYVLLYENFRSSRNLSPSSSSRNLSPLHTIF